MLSLIDKLQKIYEISHNKHNSLLSMEGLRGFAVFLVFLVHYTTLVEPYVVEKINFFEYISYIRSVGNIGVDLFFVLSGYLIYGSLIKRKQRFIPYLRRRIERIYPVFSVVFLIYIGLSIAFPAESKLPQNDSLQLIAYLSENYLLLPGIFQITPIITVAWSLSYEFFFYLSIPFLLFVSSLRNWKPNFRFILFIIISVVIFFQPAVVYGHIRLTMFISGILLFETIKYFKVPSYINIIGILALLFAISSVIIIKAFDLSGIIKFVVLFVCFYLLCLACFSTNGLCHKVFSWTPMRWLGNISYSYYMIHGLVLKFMFMILNMAYEPSGYDVQLFWICIPLMFFATFITSTILFIAIEKPFSLKIQKK